MGVRVGDSSLGEGASIGNAIYEDHINLIYANFQYDYHNIQLSIHLKFCIDLKYTLC